MKTWKISEIEKKLGKKLRQNTIIIAFDSSEHKTGVSILRTTDKSLIIDKVYKIEVPKEVKELDAIDLFTEQLDNLKNELMQKYKFDKNLIENCFIGLNPKTGIWLARIGVLAYDRFKRISKYSELIYPRSARAILGFKKSNKKNKGKKLKQDLANFINNLLDLKLTDFDIVDSILLGLSGLIIK